MLLPLFNLPLFSLLLYHISAYFIWKHIETAIPYLQSHTAANGIIRDALDDLEGQVDYVLFDQAGAFTQVMYTLLYASQEMLIPCILEPFAADGLVNMLGKLKRELRRNMVKNSGIIPCNTDYSKAMTRAYLQQLQESFGDLVIDEIRTDTSVPYSQGENLTVFEYAEKYKKRSHAAQDYMQIAQRLLATEVQA